MKFGACMNSRGNNAVIYMNRVGGRCGGVGGYKTNL